MPCTTTRSKAPHSFKTHKKLGLKCPGFTCAVMEPLEGNPGCTLLKGHLTNHCEAPSPQGDRCAPARPLPNTPLPCRRAQFPLPAPAAVCLKVSVVIWSPLCLGLLQGEELGTSNPGEHRMLSCPSWCCSPPGFLAVSSAAAAQSPGCPECSWPFPLPAPSSRVLQSPPKCIISREPLSRSLLFEDSGIKQVAKCQAQSGSEQKQPLSS